jgi:peptidoglycan/xylan/chitin deacetylase (PgdA/CDA1 family)
MAGGKRERLARWAARTGLTRALGLLGQRTQLIVLNYHRLGSAADTRFDSGVFSATPEDFESQLRFLAERFHVVDLETAVSFVEGNRSWRGAGILITFDDGYADNHELALPILRAHGHKAVFFLSTAFVGTTRVPWWDQIAFALKTSTRGDVHLRYPSELHVHLDDSDREPLVRQILALYKSPQVGDRDRFLAELLAACGLAADGLDQPLFMSWDQAAELVASGMDVGSHTHTHPVLSSLNEGDQERELAVSKETLEDRLGISVTSLAYPVGTTDSFAAVTAAAARRLGYRAAFSYYGGFNRPGSMNPFDVRRQSVDAEISAPRFRLQLQIGAATGRFWA